MEIYLMLFWLWNEHIGNSFNIPDAQNKLSYYVTIIKHINNNNKVVDSSMHEIFK